MKIEEKDGWLHADVTVSLKYGVCARPAAMIVKATMYYPHSIIFERNGIEVSCKSIMGLLTLELADRTQVHIRVEGTDQAAQDILIQLFKLLTDNDHDW